MYCYQWRVEEILSGGGGVAEEVYQQAPNLAELPTSNDHNASFY